MEFEKRWKKLRSIPYTGLEQTRVFKTPELCDSDFIPSSSTPTKLLVLVLMLMLIEQLT